MATKIIHFLVHGRREHAEFRPDCSAADMRDLFQAAAEAEPHDILKLYDANGSLVNITPRLEANGEDAYYRLEVVASDLKGLGMPLELDNMEHRLHHLERRVIEEVGDVPEVLHELQIQVESFKKKLESLEHMSWLGLFRTDRDLHLAHPKPPTPQPRAREGLQKVRRRFLHMSSLQLTEDIKEHLKTPLFDNWQWEESELLVLLQLMFNDLDFLALLYIEPDVLHNFLFDVYRHYNDIPFHNFRHCFCVTQMMYSLIWLTDLRTKLPPLDLLVLLTSTLCHDLDHTGYNNAYQINAMTDLALRYNNQSPLENHHCTMTFGILSKPECNILKNLSHQQYRHVRAGLIRCILATDMARHNEILHQFRTLHPVFDFTNKEHKEVLMKIMVKVSDISNEARPLAVSEPWMDRLLQEFFNQSDTEKLKGLPVAPFMDRDQVFKPSSQISFIQFVLLPLFTELTKLFPCLEQHILKPVQQALEYYSNMDRAMKQKE
ncbi:high affinity cGMP-specific 3',5'-cyclic phosphodiesterase 9A-like isoform X2 [Antennarius striatus]|uniref:high affinity cGMP-specific 3',5'-cyclic phosphodiesterase 9A-like isoform X2 n=1 Tax=Antennarius striatus TaxID=241820 RepID=UPI0035B17859